MQKVGWAVFLPTIKVAPRWAEKIAHPTIYKLPRLKMVAFCFYQKNYENLFHDLFRVIFYK